MKPLGIEEGKAGGTKRLAMRQRLEEILSAAYPPAEADFLARIFLEHLFQMPYTRAKMEERVLSQAQLHTLRAILSRSLRQEPWQYILGEAPFDVLSLEVTPAVLIPRPETEELLGLARTAIEKVYRGKAPIHILDMGSGSGCLALGMKYYFPEARVSAVDISEEALEVARRNALRNKLELNFLQADILSSPPPGISPVDVIISNPPYVLIQDKAAMQPNVLAWEPWNALFAPETDPLHFYKAILDWADKLLLPSGLIFLEIHEKTGRAMKDLLDARAYEDVRILKDFRGKDRFCLARKP